LLRTAKVIKIPDVPMSDRLKVLSLWEEDEMKILRSRWAKAIALIIAILVGVIAVVLVWALWVYPAEYVYRVLAWRESDAFDWQKFPEHPLEAAPTTFYFDQAPDERVRALFEALAGVDDWDAFLEANDTQAFIVVQDNTVVYEKHFNDTQRDSIVTSFSVAKSFASALIGIAIDEGYIHSVDDPITDYLPELSARDPRFSDITIRHLLLMASGLEYTADRFPLFNGDDPLTTYYPDQREIALENTNIVDPPGEYFLYNKYHPQLLGMILERTTGVSVTEYLQTKIWDPLGMEFSGSWSVDSKASDFEKMETGVNARAIDFAKFGQLFLEGGDWNGERVISEAWVADSTQPVMPADYAAYYADSDYIAAMPGRGYYRYMWWGMERDDGSYDYAAEGDKGQFIYVSPQHNLVIVRNGVDYGIPGPDWLELFFQLASDF
jgi:CubicO group peptidase (beta-lactamase class C family)